jgi:hypothetical protein
MEQKKGDFTSDRDLRDESAFTRRQMVKAMGFGAVSTSLVALPVRWTKPLVEKVMVPAHAQTSPSPTPPPEPTATLCAVSQEDFSGELPVRSTDFSGEVVSIEQWLPGNGPLGRVEITLTGNIEGMARVENQSTDPEDITVTLSVVLTTVDPTGESNVQTPRLSRTETFDAFDGDTDWMGPSGRTYTDIQATDEQVIVYTEPDKLAVFTGTGFVDFTISAQSTSNASGSGNIASDFDTNAGLEIQVVYYCF